MFTDQKTNEFRREGGVTVTAEGPSYRKKSQPNPAENQSVLGPAPSEGIIEPCAPVSSEERLHCGAFLREGMCSLISLNAHLAYT